MPLHVSGAAQARRAEALPPSGSRFRRQAAGACKRRRCPVRASRAERDSGPSGLKHRGASDASLGEPLGSLRAAGSVLSDKSEAVIDAAHWCPRLESRSRHLPLEIPHGLPDFCFPGQWRTRTGSKRLGCRVLRSPLTRRESPCKHPISATDRRKRLGRPGALLSYWVDSWTRGTLGRSGRGRRRRQAGRHALGRR